MISDLFNDWESVQVIIDSYAKQNGFVVVKSRKDKVEDISLHRECSSYKTNCPWQASFYFGKKSNLIRLTKFVQEHNHQCDPESIELAPKNLRLSQQIIDKIEYYTTNGNLAREDDLDYVVIPRLEGLANELTGLFWMTSYQCNDLWPKYHDVIYDTTLKTNRYEMALSLFVAVDNNYKTRIVAQALTKYENQADFNWILQCTLQASNNLAPKVLFTDSDLAIIAAVQLRGDMASSFVKDFYTMRNSYSEEQFNMKYQEMLDKYEPCCPYLEKRIYPSRESWTRYCISKIFTVGIESTQRVESINGVIKKLVDRGTLLKELVTAIECELDKESHYT
ncbi:unnamed protein product [Rhizophagus irregularis]|nr:unnamed protein product [Rhizophagus irregularis]